MRKIAISCGHGKDTYPPSKGIFDFAEYDFNNQVGKYAKDLAEYNGFEIIMLQPFDSNDVGLKYRSILANNEICDLLISIHADAHSNSSVNGYHAFYWHSSKNGKKLADLWRKNANAILPNSDRGLTASQPNTWANFHILRETDMPSILIEHAFYTNHDELKLLKSDDFRKLCAKVIVKTLCDYFEMEFKEVTHDIACEMKQIKLNLLGNKTEVKGVLIDDENYGNLREIFEKLGLTVGWDQEEQKINVDFKIKA